MIRPQTASSCEAVLSPSLITGVDDAYLALALPLIAYWGVSAVFHVLDEYDFYPQYRLHPPSEVSTRNRVSRWDCLRDVLIQQLLQTLAGLAVHLSSEPERAIPTECRIAEWACRLRVAEQGLVLMLALIGVNAADLSKESNNRSSLSDIALWTWNHSGTTACVPVKPDLDLDLTSLEILIAKMCHYFFWPACQYLLAMFIVDTWQYFLHRLMHTNKWCYRTFHVRHHRLYVPYAYGALYNHPLEGFVGDTVGTGVAFYLCGLTTRQAIWFFTLATIKTVDDHCGYAFPWDPLQHLTSNNSTYHDIHHQSWGMKTNFSQPFFTFWDRFLGTTWTGLPHKYPNKEA